MSDGQYVDGVPFILRKKFYPIHPFQFENIPALPENSSSFEVRVIIVHFSRPHSFSKDKLPSNLYFIYQYDFTFERNIISSSEAYLKQKETLEKVAAERRARLEELRIIEEEKRRHDEEERHKQDEEERQRLEEARQIQIEESRLHEDGDEDGDNDRTATPVQEISYQPEQLVNRTRLPTSPGGLPRDTEPPHLKPQLRNSLSDMRVTTSSSDNQSSSARLNLSDFESEAASPFDTVALRCLDDRWELEKVWANTMNLNSNYFPIPAQSNNHMHVTQGVGRSIPHSQDYAPQAQPQHTNGPTMTISSSLPTRSGTNLAVIPGSFASTGNAASSFVPHPQPHWSSHPYYTTTLPQTVSSVIQNQIPGMTPTPTPTTSHLSSPSIPPVVTSSESFTSFQFPFLSRFARPNRLPENRIQGPPPYEQQRRWNNM